MKIPTKGRFAISAMLDLALHDNIKPLTIAEIAEKQNISLSYLEQIFAVLRKNGLVRGMRGPGGGYRLAQSADSISIAQIIHSVVENSADKVSDTESYLPYVLWGELSDQIYRFLDNITLTQCINDLEVKSTLSTQLHSKTDSADQVAA